ncbi:copine-9-like [Clytia hemisphaerica]|uniref:copine-9-like n=1 Tax=Clytia hemisphaerica TaxID=252671 RepID=UPI0034D58241
MFKKKRSQVMPDLMIASTTSLPQSPTIYLPKSPTKTRVENIAKEASKRDKMYVELFIKCRDIISVDMFSKTDPFVVLHVRRYGKWFEYGRTETIANCHRPLFTETFYVDTNNTDNRRLKASLYDGDNLSSRDLQKCKLLGTTDDLEVENLLRGDLDFKDFHFKHESGKKTGTLSMCAIPVRNSIESKKEVRLSLGAGKLAKKHFFNRASVFLQINREIFEDTYHPVYRSEVIFKANYPRWKLFSINIQKLCNGDRDGNLLFQILAHNAKGEPEIKGQLVTTLHQLQSYKGLVKEINLRRMSSSKRSLGRAKNKESNAGYLKLYHVSVDEQFSLVDYIRSGTQIKCSIGIDFTLSNGCPLTNERSLHHLQKQNGSNDYITALKQVGTWLSYYCKRIPLYGFGGKLYSKVLESQPNNRSSQCFIESTLNNLKAIDGNNEFQLVGNNNNNNDNILTKGEIDDYCFEINKNNADLDAIILSYKDIIPMVEPGGPTYFKQIMSKLYDKSNLVEIGEVRESSSDVFYVMLIVTDGVSNDESEFEKYLSDLSDEPVIIILAGVGPCSFQPTQYLVNRVNKKVKRKLLFFYRITQDSSSGGGGNSSHNIKELYASISKSVVDYNLKKGVYPKETNSHDSLMLDAESSLIPADQFLNSRSNSPLLERNSCCPTCGSYVNLTSLTSER